MSFRKKDNLFLKIVWLGAFFSLSITFQGQGYAEDKLESLIAKKYEVFTPQLRSAICPAVQFLGSLSTELQKTSDFDQSKLLRQMIAAVVTNGTGVGGLCERAATLEEASLMRQSIIYAELRRPQNDLDILSSYQVDMSNSISSVSGKTLCIQNNTTHGAKESVHKIRLKAEDLTHHQNAIQLTIFSAYACKDISDKIVEFPDKEEILLKLSQVIQRTPNLSFNFRTPFTVSHSFALDLAQDLWEVYRKNGHEQVLSQDLLTIQAPQSINSPGKLPFEIWSLIVSHLPAEDAFFMTALSRRFYTLRNDQSLWEKIFKHEGYGQYENLYPFSEANSYDNCVAGAVLDNLKNHAESNEGLPYKKNQLVSMMRGIGSGYETTFPHLRTLYHFRSNFEVEVLANLFEEYLSILEASDFPDVLKKEEFSGLISWLEKKRPPYLIGHNICLNLFENHPGFNNLPSELIHSSNTSLWSFIEKTIGAVTQHVREKARVANFTIFPMTLVSQGPENLESPVYNGGNEQFPTPLVDLSIVSSSPALNNEEVNFKRLKSRIYYILSGDNSAPADSAQNPISITIEAEKMKACLVDAPKDIAAINNKHTQAFKFGDYGPLLNEFSSERHLSSWYALYRGHLVSYFKELLKTIKSYQATYVHSPMDDREEDYGMVPGVNLTGFSFGNGFLTCTVTGGSIANHLS